jgi:hypothetical protein
LNPLHSAPAIGLRAREEQRIGRLSGDLLDALCRFQETNEGASYEGPPGQPRLSDFLGYLLWASVHFKGGRGVKSELMKSDARLRMAFTVLRQCRRSGGRRLSATEMMALAVAAGIEDGTSDDKRRLDTWRRRRAAADALERKHAAQGSQMNYGAEGRALMRLRRKWPSAKVTSWGEMFARWQAAQKP